METREHAVYIWKKSEAVDARGSAGAPAEGSVRHRQGRAVRSALSILLAATLAVPLAVLETTVPLGGGVLKARRRLMRRWEQMTIRNCFIASRKAVTLGAFPATY